MIQLVDLVSSYRDLIFGSIITYLYCIALALGRNKFGRGNNSIGKPLLVFFFMCLLIIHDEGLSGVGKIIFGLLFLISLGIYLMECIFYDGYILKELYQISIAIAVIYLFIQLLLESQSSKHLLFTSILFAFYDYLLVWFILTLRDVLFFPNRRDEY